MRLDVTSHGVRRTFLAPFDRPIYSSDNVRLRRVRSAHARARLCRLLVSSGGSRTVGATLGRHLAVLPYQLEPALAMLDSVRRLLIADEVGLGKTVQAGLILAELSRRDPELRALVLVPASLAGQWRAELRRHFSLRAAIADADALARLAQSGARGDHPLRRPGLWIASLDYLKQAHVLQGLPASPWDALVLDEAHTACGDSARHAAARDIAGRCRRVILLTATPHSGDQRAFGRLVALGALDCPRDELAVFRRTRRDVSTTPPRRVRWHSVPLSPAEIRLFEALAGFERAVLAAAGPSRQDAALLVLSVFRKRALSTMGALVASLERRLAWRQQVGPAERAPWRQSTLDFGDVPDEVGDEERTALDTDVALPADRERSWLRRLHALASEAGRHESKVTRAVSLLRRSSEAAVVFTEFRDSLRILAARLRGARAVEIVHGGLSPAEQRRAIGRFVAGHVSVLLATDVASQGLNLQSRARWAINLELPWNPARLEQRAGRVDRIGQQRSVHVTSLVAAPGAEARVLARLAQRALAAQQAVGRNVLDSAAPVEAALRRHLIAGGPAPDAAGPRLAFPIQRTWQRAARMIARRLARRQSLSRSRLPDRDGRTAWTFLNRFPCIDALAGGADLLVLTVPIVSAEGTEVERHVVAVRAPAACPAAPIDRRLLDAAAAVAISALGGRLRRARVLAARNTAWTSARERAIADRSMAADRTEEVQSGLFDMRADRAADAIARERADTVQDLARRLRTLANAGVLDMGDPRLELIFVPR